LCDCHYAQPEREAGPRYQRGFKAQKGAEDPIERTKPDDQVGVNGTRRPDMLYQPFD
jgi:hypothetical protein